MAVQAIPMVVVVMALCMSQMAAAANLLLPGHYLPPGFQLKDGPFRFTMQTDCNLVLYKNNRSLWASNNQNTGSNCVFIMQTDGNAVIYTGESKAVWATDTCCRHDGSHYIILQSDGNVVMYSPNGPIWATNTGGLKVDLVKHGFMDKTGPQLNTMFKEQHVEFKASP